MNFSESFGYASLIIAVVIAAMSGLWGALRLFSVLFAAAEGKKGKRGQGNDN